MLLALGPARQVLHVLNEWFAWSWLKVMAAHHVLTFAVAQKAPAEAPAAALAAHSPPLPFELELETRSAGGAAVAAAAARGLGASEDATRTGVEDAGEAEPEASPAHKRRTGARNEAPAQGRPEAHSPGRDSDDEDDDAADSSNLLRGKPAAAGGKPGRGGSPAGGTQRAGKAAAPGAPGAAGSWNAGGGLRLRLLVPPLAHYAVVACLLAFSLTFGNVAHSMVHETV